MQDDDFSPDGCVIDATLIDEDWTSEGSRTRKIIATPNLSCFQFKVKSTSIPASQITLVKVGDGKY